MGTSMMVHVQERATYLPTLSTNSEQHRYLGTTLVGVVTQTTNCSHIHNSHRTLGNVLEPEPVSQQIHLPRAIVEYAHRGYNIERCAGVFMPSVLKVSSWTPGPETTEI